MTPKLPYAIAASVAAIMAIGAPAARAQSIVLDDFTTGPTKLSVIIGDKYTYQKGSGIAGGQRSTEIVLNSNLYGQPALVQVHRATQTAPAALAYGEGFDTFAQVNFRYGRAVTGIPLHLDVSAYDRIRIHFLGIERPMAFGIDVSTGSGYSQWGCNLPPESSAAIVDFLFSNALVGGADPSSFDSFRFYTGGGNFGVGLIEFVNSSAPPADVTC